MTRERSISDRQRNQSSQRQEHRGSSDQSLPPSHRRGTRPTDQNRNVELARRAVAEVRQSLAQPSRDDQRSIDPTISHVQSSRGAQPPIAAVPSPMDNSPAPPATSLFRRFSLNNFRFTWQLGVALGLVITGTLTAFSLAFLFKLPAVPNCPAVFWPLASASLRLHCAHLAANKQTADDLLEAIKLLNTLPRDHPLNDEATHLIEEWSADILQLGDEAFQAGKLEGAIAIAEKVPSNAEAAKLVKDRVEQWKKIWADAEKITARVEELLRQQDWRNAFTQAARLLSIDNNFWQTTKYQEITTLITRTREDGQKLGRAKRLMENGGLDQLLEAIKLATSINEPSFIYQDAQAVIPQIGRRMLDLAENLLDRRNLNEALNVLDKIPAAVNLKDEIDDFRTLAMAQSKAWSGKVVDVEAAIAEAQRIDLSRPLYIKAQSLITRWQIDIAGGQQLDKARQIAQGGSIDALREAILEASLVSSNNPRAREAQQMVDDMNRKIEEAEDRPILDQAIKLAQVGDANALQAAISTAEQIAPTRALYKQSQAKIQQWTAIIHRMQDDPILTLARGHMNSGDLVNAIDTAKTIGSGRPSSQEAQSIINEAQMRLQSEQSLQQAREAANGGTVEALVSAINLAQQVPSNSALRTEANQAIGLWSQQILQTAISQAEVDVPSAIAIAQNIPPNTPAYTDAQSQVAIWRKRIGQ